MVGWTLKGTQTRKDIWLRTASNWWISFFGDRTGIEWNVAVGFWQRAQPQPLWTRDSHARLPGVDEGSFANAWRGLTRFVRQEQNAWIHCGMTILVVLAGFLFKITNVEWLAVVFAIGLVLAGEAINSAIERLSDVVQPERDDRIRDVKDISAGA